MSDVKWNCPESANPWGGHCSCWPDYHCCDCSESPIPMYEEEPDDAA